MPSRPSITLTATILSLLFTIYFYFSTPSTPPHFPLDQIITTNPTGWSPRPFLPPPAASQTCSHHRLPIHPNRTHPRKIYDLFFINTELDWLEIRLLELHLEIDFFVILESTTTFSGSPKPLHLQRNWSRFKPYHHQIIYTSLNCSHLDFKDTWARERYQRNAVYDTVLPFLSGVQKPVLGDIIITSDIDEIPYPTTPPLLRNCLLPPRTTLHSTLHYYSFQWRFRSPNNGWHRLKTTPYNHNLTIRPDDLRSTPPDLILMHTSWHCSSCLPTLADMVDKIRSFSHSEFDRPEFTERGRILQRVRGGVDLFERRKLVYDRVGGGLDAPGVVLRDTGGRWRYLIERDEVGGGFRDFDPERDLRVEGWEGNGTWVPEGPEIPVPKDVE